MRSFALPSPARPVRGCGPDDLPASPMTQAALPLERTSDVRVITVMSAAHFVSHYYILLLPPLFAFVRADYGVELHAGRPGAHRLQRHLGGAADAGRLPGRPPRRPHGADRRAAARRRPPSRSRPLVDSFWVLVAMFGVAGIGNTVYHPADYAILSHHVSPGADRPGLLDPHLRRHARPRAGAGEPAVHAERRGAGAAPSSARPSFGFAVALLLAVPGRLARRPRRRARRTRPPPRRRPTTRKAGGFCSPARSCATSFSSCCSRSITPASKTIRWSRSARCTGPGRASPIARCRPSCCSAPSACWRAACSATRIPRHGPSPPSGFAHRPGRGAGRARRSAGAADRGRHGGRRASSTA